MTEIIGAKIKHKTLGEGIIKDVIGKNLSVEFKKDIKLLALDVILKNKIITGDKNIIEVLEKYFRQTSVQQSNPSTNIVYSDHPVENSEWESIKTKIIPKDAKLNKVNNQDSRKEIHEKAPKTYTDLMTKKDPIIMRSKHPIIADTKEIAKTWWGKRWNNNLENYADYRNRIGRGRSSLRQGAVIDLDIGTGCVDAMVVGSKNTPYKVKIAIDTLSDPKKEKLYETCENKIGSLEELLYGTFPEEYEKLFMNGEFGLFPGVDEIHFDCTCPDWAYMCKHVAAVLYGISIRLDEDPMLFFKLRDIEMSKLIEKTMADKIESILIKAGQRTKRTIDDKEAYELFGL